MEVSTLTQALSQHPRLRARIEAIVWAQRWADSAADLTAPVPIDQLAWAVAANDGLRPDPEAIGHNLDQAEQAITDAGLEPVVMAALARLATTN